MDRTTLNAQKCHLADLLEAIQRCTYFLDASSRKLEWPLRAEKLIIEKRNVGLFETLAAINERFAKLQDTLAAAMRHASLLSGEPTDRFLKVLSFYEKVGVLESVEIWHLCRAKRNLAAHDYETDYTEIAEHFNALHQLSPVLYRAAGRFTDYCRETLSIKPAASDFKDDFKTIVDISCLIKK